MNVIQVSSWEECQNKIAELEENNKNPSGVWFRGHQNSCWELQTTLERQSHIVTRVSDYYFKLHAIRRAVETFTNSFWHLPSQAEIAQWDQDYDKFSRSLWDTTKDDIALNFLTHLRHHGFPSPLLDWTGSPYVAAYFAFAHAQTSKRVAIYVFVERPNGMKVGGSDQPGIHSFGPHIRTHRRHFQQQSRYTMCLQYNISEGWNFVPHSEAFSLSRPNQDLLWKIEIPATERIKVLRFLNRFNLNAFSLFSTEDSLMEMLGFQQIDLSAP